jgi:hypothetical protein
MLAYGSSSHYVAVMSGRVIQSSAPIRYGIADGMDVGRVHNYPPRYCPTSPRVRKPWRPSAALQEMIKT